MSRGAKRKLQPEQVAQLKQMRHAGDKLDYIAAMLGVSTTTISAELRILEHAARNPNRPVLVELLNQIRSSRDANAQGAESLNLDPRTRRRYIEQVKRCDAQIAALESVT